MEWRKARPRGQKKKTEKTIITYRRMISKRLAVDTTSLYCSCSITSTNHSCSSLLKSKHAISITCTEMHADHIVSSGSPHNNVLHFSSIMWSAHAHKLCCPRPCALQLCQLLLAICSKTFVVPPTPPLFLRPGYGRDSVKPRLSSDLYYRPRAH